MKLLFLVTEDWYFVSHRLQLARAARDAGAEVLVMTHITKFRLALEKERFMIIPWRISRRSLNPFRELYVFFQVVRAYKRERPDLVHHVALKPIVYGGLASRLCGRVPSVNAITGLGHVFTSSLQKPRLLRSALSSIIRSLFNTNGIRVIFQNHDDLNLLLDEGVVSRERSLVIRGAGVNADEFLPRPEPSDVPLVMLASRMLWDKGVGEFVSAASKLRQSSLAARFVLVGRTDPGNPSSIKDDQLREWESAGLVEWWGHRNDMAAVIARSNVVCLPSYREGLPKVLIEAAACGRAIVATDVPGCREVVRHGDNGLLVPPRNADALAHALATLVKDPALRARMGARGRKIAVQEFSDNTVLSQTMLVYRELLGSKWNDGQREENWIATASTERY